MKPILLDEKHLKISKDCAEKYDEKMKVYFSLYKDESYLQRTVDKMLKGAIFMHQTHQMKMVLHHTATKLLVMYILLSH